MHTLAKVLTVQSKFPALWSLEFAGETDNSDCISATVKIQQRSQRPGESLLQASNSRLSPPGGRKRKKTGLRPINSYMERFFILLIQLLDDMGLREKNVGKQL